MKNCHNKFGRVESINQDDTISVRYTDGKTDKNKSKCLFKKYVSNRNHRSRLSEPMIVLEKTLTVQEYWESANVSATSIVPERLRQRKVIAYNK